MSTAILDKPVGREMLSAKNLRWFFASYDEKQANYYSAKYNLPFSVTRILASRDIPQDEMDNFLEPKLKNLMPSPFVLNDMEKACDILSDKIIAGKEIGVFGDYDVDGGTSSAIMKRFFDMVGVTSHIHIPDRMLEGYGPNIEAFRSLKNRGSDILVTVDCGSAAGEVMRLAKSEGIDTIIIDHHLTDGETDGAIATVNPNRKDDLSELGDLTAAGVSFMACVGIMQKLKEKGFFTEGKIIPNLLSLLDLVALGTICDVAPLTGLNRAFIAQGLRVMNMGDNAGLKALAQIGRISEEIGAYHCGFVLGPRVNAGGRVGRAGAGFELMTTACSQKAWQLAIELDEYNQQRKQAEEEMKAEILSQIEQNSLHKDPVIIVYNENWHPGIVGILASRVKELYQKPAFVLGGDGTYLKGSGRSISGVDIGTGVREAVSKNLIIGGGGHKMAAGLTMLPEQVEGIRNFFRETYLEVVQIARKSSGTLIDSELALPSVNYSLFESIQKLSPFGVGNPSPNFCLRNVVVGFYKVIGVNHLRVKISDLSGNSVNAVCFGCVDTPLAELLMRQKIKIDVLGTIKKDTYHTGDGVQFIIDDASLAGVF